MNSQTLQERLLAPDKINLSQERAMEILTAIHNLPFTWQSSQDTISKCFNPGEREEVVKKWHTMPGNTCFADALISLAYGRD